MAEFVFDVGRSTDLVWLRFTCRGFRAEVGDVLTAEQGAQVTVSFPYQHLAEQVAVPRPSSVVAARPARKSRVVLQVPAGEQVVATSEGLLTALSRYSMLLHPRGAAIPAVDPPPPAQVTEAAPATVRAVTFQVRDLRRRWSQQASSGIRADLRVPLPGRKPVLSRDAEASETMIEAPFRLVLSPGSGQGWVHATAPVPGARAGDVELWHTRLVNRPSQNEPGSESLGPPRVAAVWTRDRERHAWQEQDLPDTDDPFAMSLSQHNRHALVRQSSERWVIDGVRVNTPQPLTADRLWLSSLGAWLDLHGQWETKPWSLMGLLAYQSYDHEAPMGRDQYVKIAAPGYLYPFGHTALLIKITERHIPQATNPRAVLRQRHFLIVTEPVREYTERDQPFAQVTVAPLTTPDLSGNPTAGAFFVPHVDGAPFPFTLHATDRDGRPVVVATPLVWVPEKYDGAAPTPAAAFDALGPVAAHGQPVSYVASGETDTSLPTTSLTFTGTLVPTVGATPHLVQAVVRVPAAEQVSPLGEQPFRYAAAYVADGFGGTNTGQVWAELLNRPVMKLGTAGESSSGSGGFLAPAMPVEGLSRITGTVGDLASAAGGGFDPGAFFAGAMPKLFGLVSLTSLLEAAGVDLSQAPALVTESLAEVEAFLADVARVKAAVENAVASADQLVASATTQAADLAKQGRDAIGQELLAKAEQARAEAEALQKIVTDAAQAVEQAVLNAVQDPLSASTELATALTTLAAAADQIDAKAGALLPALRAGLKALAQQLREVAAHTQTVDKVLKYLKGVAQAAAEGRFSLTWQPKLKPDPMPILRFQPDSLTLSVRGRTGGAAPPRVDVSAELTRFSLQLPADPVVRLPFENLSFITGSSAKVEVDAKVGNLEFVGLLGFVERIKQLIPFDGFSDPPYLDVSPSGVVAGFSLALPNLAIGAFSLSNISLGADLRVPFLGDVVSVGFFFCTRESPFQLAVMCLGGGGWFCIRVSPRGLEMLELGMEVGAYLSVNLGVASGSVSAALGIYMRVEKEAAALTAYFRLRGKVSVLAIASVSVELYLALRYDFPTGKMVGQATITVKVSVLGFSKSVSITCQRQFAGSNGDPSFAEVMTIDANHESLPWSQYCAAFAEA